MIEIVDFERVYVHAARALALENYIEECCHVPALPPIDNTPDLMEFADNKLGVAALDNGVLIGFMCVYSPFEHAFASTDAVGIFSPMGANGTKRERRGEIYGRMYQAAGEKWARAGASSHAVCLYAHDRAGQEQFYRYGFGLRCVDAIRDMQEITVSSCSGYDFMELEFDELGELLELDNMLSAHMAASPCFILRPSHTMESFLESARNAKSIYIAAKQAGKPVAFIRAELDGENFICSMPGYIHIKGAFCLPEHRGKGVYQNLLNMLVNNLKDRGYTRLGVDYESINPAGSGFWGKYFSPYTAGVVRRVDEHSVNDLKLKNSMR